MIGVLSGPDGVLMVDSQFAPLTEKIVAAIKQITPAPIRFLINTHLHGDHTGGNENLGKMGAPSFHAINYASVSPIPIPEPTVHQELLRLQPHCPRPPTIRKSRSI